MSNPATQTTDWTTSATGRTAVKWLLYRHGKTVAEAAEIMMGPCGERSPMWKLRQEAQVVADFVEALHDRS